MGPFFRVFRALSIVWVSCFYDQNSAHILEITQKRANYNSTMGAEICTKNSWPSRILNRIWAEFRLGQQTSATSTSIYSRNFLTTMTKTSQKSSKWSHFSTDYDECIDLCIKALYIIKVIFELFARETNLMKKRSVLLS